MALQTKGRGSDFRNRAGHALTYGKRAEAAGANGYLIKQAGGDKLVQHVIAALRRVLGQ
jgi:hypothetical protein